MDKYRVLEYLGPRSPIEKSEEKEEKEVVVIFDADHDHDRYVGSEGYYSNPERYVTDNEIDPKDKIQA